jgi:hypothetical protein
MERKRHAVAHLPRLWDRREDLGGSYIGRKVVILAALVEQHARMIECGRSGIDQRQHRDESRIASPSALGRRSQVEQLGIAGMDQTDLFLTARFKCRKFHSILSFSRAPHVAIEI